MPREFKTLMDKYNTSIEHAKKQCSSEIDELATFVEDTALILKKVILPSEVGYSLTGIRFGELARVFHFIMYLSLCGLYRNTFDCIRYLFESFVQSIYIDARHPKSGLRTRIEILKEIEDKKEYHAIRLIHELKIDQKDTLSKEYKKLSQIIHPSHRNFVQIMQDFQAESLHPKINCKEISDINKSLKMIIDIVLFLYVSNVGENLIESMKKDTELMKYCEVHGLNLLPKILKFKRK